jgi:hypothetical protein
MSVRRKDGGAVVSISPTSAAVVYGEEDLSGWDDEELIRGTRRNKNGKFTGRKPRFIPRELLQELHRRRTHRTFEVLDSSLEIAAKRLRACIAGQKPLTLAELKAIEMLFNRVYGRPREQIQFDLKSVSDEPSKWEKLVASVVIVGNQDDAAIAQQIESAFEGEVLDDTYVEEETAREREEHLTAAENRRPTEVAPRQVDVPPTDVWPVDPPPPPPAPERGPKSAG